MHVRVLDSGLAAFLSCSVYLAAICAGTQGVEGLRVDANGTGVWVLENLRALVVVALGGFTASVNAFEADLRLRPLLRRPSFKQHL